VRPGAVRYRTTDRAFSHGAGSKAHRARRATRDAKRKSDRNVTNAQHDDNEPTHRLVCVMQRHRCGRVRAMPPADPDLIRLHTAALRIAEMLGPLVESIVLLQKEGDRRRRMAVLPAVSRVIAGSLDVGNIFQELGAAVRTVLDFDLMLVRPIGASGTLQRSMLLVGDVPADVQSERRLEDYSFGARLAAKEIVLLNDAWSELDQSFP